MLIVYPALIKWKWAILKFIKTWFSILISRESPDPHRKICSQAGNFTSLDGV